MSVGFDQRQQQTDTEIGEMELSNQLAQLLAGIVHTHQAHGVQYLQPVCKAALGNMSLHVTVTRF